MALDNANARKMRKAEERRAWLKEWLLSLKRNGQRRPTYEATDEAIRQVFRLSIKRKDMKAITDLVFSEAVRAPVEPQPKPKPNGDLTEQLERIEHKLDLVLKDLGTVTV